MSKYLSILFSLLLLPLLAPAQSVGTAAPPADTLTLVQLLDQALRGNPKLQAVHNRALGARTRVDQASAWDDPQAGVEFYATPVTYANPFTQGMETDYFLQQMIPLFGKKGLMEDAARAGAGMSEQSAVAAERDLTAEVKKGYAMILAAQQRIDVNTENQRLLRQLIESARSRFAVGIASLGDVLKAQVEMDKLQNERAGLDQDLAGAVSMMNALRNLPADAPLGRLAALPLAPVPGTLADATARALENRPELRGMSFELAMNKADLSASERERVPDLMVRGTYKQMREGTDQWAAMFSINIPIAPWASSKYSGKIEEQTLNVKAAEQSLAEMRNMVQAEVRTAWTRSTARWQQIERYRQSMLPQSQQALESTLASYESGRVDFLSVLDSYRMLEMLKMDYYMLLGDYTVSLAQLERAVGSELR